MRADKQYTSVICPRGREWGEMPFSVSPAVTLEVFDERTVAFLDALASDLLRSISLESAPDLAALAFWLRRNNIMMLKDENRNMFNRYNLSTTPLGKVFHYFPADRGAMFMYVLAISLLLGNRNLVRIGRPDTSIRFLFRRMNALLGEERFAIFQEYVNIVLSRDDKKLVGSISPTVNARIISVSDPAACEAVRSSNGKDIILNRLPSRVVINLAAFATLDERAAAKFRAKLASDINTFERLRDIGYIVLGMGGRLEELEELVHAATGSDRDTRMGIIGDLSELFPEGNTRLSTITHFGLDPQMMEEMKRMLGSRNVDRVIPLGQALLFHYVCNGYNLFDILSKKVYLER